MQTFRAADPELIIRKQFLVGGVSLKVEKFLDSLQGTSPRPTIYLTSFYNLLDLVLLDLIGSWSPSPRTNSPTSSRSPVPSTPHLQPTSESQVLTRAWCLRGQVTPPLPCQPIGEVPWALGCRVPCLAGRSA